MRAPQRAETITATSLTTFDYAERTYLAANFSDGSTHVLSFGGNGATIDNDEVSIQLPANCSSEIYFEGNWEEIPSDSIDATLMVSECEIDGSELYTAIDIIVGNVIFRRDAERYVPSNVESFAWDSFVKI